MLSLKRIFVPAYCLLFLVSCNTSKNSLKPFASNEIVSLKFLSEYQIPYGLSYANTTVGGLSGIDYDAKEHSFFMISDDRSSINPARFYLAKIYINKNNIDSVRFNSVTNLLQTNGIEYPGNKKDAYNTPDPEAIRYNALSKKLVWSSEGERIVREKDTILSDPSIRIMNGQGLLEDSFPIPSNLHMQAVEKGPRQNSVFEGLAFANNYTTLYVSVEEPLYEDGPRADITDNNAYVRILKFDTQSKKNIGQYAYKLDPVAYAPDPANGFKINGIPDILSIGENKLLVVERSFSTGRLACTIKVFLTDLSEATDIKNIPSLKENKNFNAASKKLLLNMDDLGIYIDNIEGVTFGPLLSNGHRSLLFIADNNFNPLEKSQLLLFEITDK